MFNLDLGLVALIFSVIGLSSILAVACYKLVACQQFLFGADARSRDRERQDYLRVITQLMEKLSARPHSEDALDMTRIHTAERNNAASLNARMEEKAGMNSKPRDPPLMSTVDPEIGAMYQ